jgi:uncharacterized protein
MSPFRPPAQVVPFEFKIVVSGAFGAGKTTLINSISDVPVVGTEVATSGDESALKQSTTVGMEYGSYSICDHESDITLYLYGTPGQERFQFMWEILSKGMDGCLILIDASRPETWSEARQVATYFRSLNRGVCALVANRWAGNELTLEALRAAVGVPDSVAVLTCDLSDRQSARSVLVEILELILESEERRLVEAGKL